MSKYFHKHKGFAAVMLSIGVFILIMWVAIAYLPPGVDWSTVFYPASRSVLEWRSPYQVDGFYNAPWTALLLLPFTVFSEAISRVLAMLFGLVTFAYVAKKFGAKAISVIFLLLSPPVLHGALNGNIDWLAALGFILPPQIGLFFISIKPQLGIAVGIFWLVEAWRKNGWREVLRVFGPFSVVLGASFMLFGFWPLRARMMPDLWWNASLWPMSIPIGLVLIVLSIRKRKLEYAMGASPCLSPYILLHSWVVVLLAIVTSTVELIAAVIGLWILVIFF